MSAILFGSISTIADTSELQRRSFNEAFESHGLDWRWDRDEYVGMLGSNGGEDRIDSRADSLGQDVDASAIHRTKSEIFQRKLSESHLSARPGVVDTVRQAKERGVKVALVTTTSSENVAAMLGALAPELTEDDFDLVVDSSSVSDPKPDPAAYAFALERLGERTEDCVAIEDNVGGVQAAMAAGLRCLAFPNENTATHDFTEADQCLEQVDFDVAHEVIAGS